MRNRKSRSTRLNTFNFKPKGPKVRGLQQILEKKESRLIQFRKAHGSFLDDGQVYLTKYLVKHSKDSGTNGLSELTTHFLKKLSKRQRLRLMMWAKDNTYDLKKIEDFAWRKLKKKEREKYSR